METRESAVLTISGAFLAVAELVRPPVSKGRLSCSSVMAWGGRGFLPHTLPWRKAAVNEVWV